MGWPQAVVLVLVVLRLAELALSQRNQRRLMARGGNRIADDGFAPVVILQVAWLAAVFSLIPADTTPDPFGVAVLAACQAVRGWTMAVLGDFWTARGTTLTGVPTVTAGPYRWLRHPNYWAVVVEVAALPLTFAAWELAAGFTVVNLPLMLRRMRVEDRALTDRRPSL